MTTFRLVSALLRASGGGVFRGARAGQAPRAVDPRGRAQQGDAARAEGRAVAPPQR